MQIKKNKNRKKNVFKNYEFLKCARERNIFGEQKLMEGKHSRTIQNR